MVKGTILLHEEHNVLNASERHGCEWVLSLIDSRKGPD